jgi:hypothetical protein
VTIPAWVFLFVSLVTPWPLVRKRTISTERPPLVDEILVQTFVDRGVSRGQRSGTPTAVNFSFLDRSFYFFFQVAPRLCSWGWVDLVPDPLLLRKSGSAGNRTRDLWDCSQKLWPLYYRGGLRKFNAWHKFWEGESRNFGVFCFVCFISNQN